MKVCFIGHRTIQKNEELISALKETIVQLINMGVTTFLFGSKSAFNTLSWEIVSALRLEYPFIKRVYVRSAFQYIDKNYKEYLLKSFEETYFPQKLENAGKYSYVERNREMIDTAKYCVFYYNEDYIPTENGKRERVSGTKVAYEYAKQKKKNIINLYK